MEVERLLEQATSVSSLTRLKIPCSEVDEKKKLN